MTYLFGCEQGFPEEMTLGWGLTMNKAEVSCRIDMRQGHPRQTCQLAQGVQGTHLMAEEDEAQFDSSWLEQYGRS